MSKIGHVLLTKSRWYEPDSTPQERKLLFKLDLMILTYASFAFFTKFLDVSALNNAYVSGMKEDIGMKGNDLTYVNAVYESCYCVFQIPINLLLTAFPTSYILPASELGWGIATLGTAFVQNTHQLMACRGLLGLFAASNYSGCTFVIASWYKKNERAKRMTLFWISNPIGTAVGGWLQAAIYTNQNLALKSWRILFVVCSCITIVVSVYGFIALPNLPHDIRSRFLSEEEKQLAVERVSKENIVTKRKLLDIKSFVKLLYTWKTPLFAFLLFSQVFSYYPSGTPFTLWLKSRQNLTIPQINNIPTGGNALSLISALFLGWYADTFDDRLTPYVIATTFAIIGNSILVNFNTSEGAKYTAFLFLFISHGVAPIWQAWASDLTSHNSELRAYSIASGNVASEVGSLVVPLIVFKVTQSPRFKAGFIFSLVISIAELFIAISISFLDKRYPITTDINDDDWIPSRRTSGSISVVEYQQAREK
ncbi:Pantothenate transporter [Wickerhamomyces ciferrii]|uniref:Pantothenate transporter n=1 Tax=Wickerhamomyces ciferrii (strain ATCC 14091 / BCRC 22168 / CBS 111 / JCM 3599 / NBRC 0793 / NRRL Y-1031 F-60-10) TaxID=1206466 RepID=K0KJF0_WICCF|nr:Pantothenate transporter [Wickerhamomyces ciferrii]CCH45370.1 Pantothenate transporter [Wickerhamomyces ciferrii]